MIVLSTGLSNGRIETSCSKMGGDGVKQWYGMGESGRNGCGGLKASDTSRDIYHEIVTNVKAFGFGRFGGAEGWSRTDVVTGERWKECGAGCEVWQRGGSSEGGWNEMMVGR